LPKQQIYIIMEGASTSGASAATGNSGDSNSGTTATTKAEGTNTNNTTTEVKETKDTEKKTDEKETKAAPNEEKKEKTQRDLFYERHKKDYPDDDEADEDLVYRRINERNAAYDKLKQSDDDFRKVVHDHPQFGGMFLDAIDGKGFMESFLGRFSKEDVMAAYDDPEMAKKLSDSYSEYTKSKETNKKLGEERDSNVKESAGRFAKYCEKNDIGEEEMNAMWNEMLDIYEDGWHGKFTDKLFDKLRKAANYDGDVESARQEGEIAGHNAKVKTTLAKGAGPQGLPPTFEGGQGKALEEPKPKEKKIRRNPFTHEDQEFD